MSNTPSISEIIDDDVALVVIASVRDEKWIRVVEALNQLALDLVRRGQYKQALERLRRALDLTHPLSGANDQRDMHLEMVLRSATYNNLGVMFKAQNKLREAWYYVNKALRLDALTVSFVKGNVATWASNSKPISRLLIESDSVISYLNLCAILSALKRHQTAQVYAECALSALSARVKRIADLNKSLENQKVELAKQKSIEEKSASTDGTGTVSLEAVQTALSVCKVSMATAIRLISAALHNLAVEYEHQHQYAAATATYERARDFASYQLSAVLASEMTQAHDPSNDETSITDVGSEKNKQAPEGRLDEFAMMVQTSCEQALRNALDEHGMRTSLNSARSGKSQNDTTDKGDEAGSAQNADSNDTPTTFKDLLKVAPRVYLSPREVAANFRADRAKVLPVQNRFAILGDADVSLARALGDVSKLSGMPKPIEQHLMRPNSARTDTSASLMSFRAQRKVMPATSADSTNMTCNAASRPAQQLPSDESNQPLGQGAITKAALQFPQIATRAANVSHNTLRRNSVITEDLRSHWSASFDAGDGLDDDEEDTIAAAIEADILNWNAWDPASSKKLAERCTSQRSSSTALQASFKSARDAMISLQERHHLQQLEQRHNSVYSRMHTHSGRTAQLIVKSRQAEKVLAPRDYPLQPRTQSTRIRR